MSQKAVLLEAGAAILFFGTLMHSEDLERSAAGAMNELKQRGYVFSVDAPIRVYPAVTGGDFTAAHAGGWRPGVISLREKPEGTAGPDVIIRHELMHEASFRTCHGKLPVWAEEAAALAFSGEPPPAGSPSAEAMEALRRRIKSGARLDREAYLTLARLVSLHGWPESPCAVSEIIERELSTGNPPESAGFSAVLIHMASGRILETVGDQKRRYPPGSLLKIPFAAALTEFPATGLGEELARSDTERLMARRNHLDFNRFRFFLSTVENADLGKAVSEEDSIFQSDTFWRSCLGERGLDGHFPLEASLPELARVIRAALLFRPEVFAGLSRNGLIEGTTLFSQPTGEKVVLTRLRAMSKTGSVRDERERPMVGHLMVAWPEENPAFLGVFRGGGMPGAALLHRAAPLMTTWSTQHPASNSKVRVRLMSLTPRESWEIIDVSPTFERPLRDGSRRRVSSSGRFRIISSAPRSRSDRIVSGVLDCSADGQTVVLETDPDTYAEAVLTAEAQDLPLEARKAIAAVIVWNATRGISPHPETASLCDSTHCMVFQGDREEIRKAHRVVIDPSLLTLLTRLSGETGSGWFPFSKGGNENWTKVIPSADLRRIVNEPDVLDLRRERTRSGDIRIHLVYPDTEETVPCEVFRNRLKLFSCPDNVYRDEASGTWVFTGIGEGHGAGLSMERARMLAESGRNAAAILADAYKNRNEKP